MSIVCASEKASAASESSASVRVGWGRWAASVIRAQRSSKWTLRSVCRFAMIACAWMA